MKDKDPSKSGVDPHASSFPRHESGEPGRCSNNTMCKVTVEKRKGKLSRATASIPKEPGGGSIIETMNISKLAVEYVWVLIDL